MKKKRERLEIIKDILIAIRDKGNNVKPTHILYRSNLSHKMLKEYLKELLEKSLVEENFDKKNNITYSITPKGANYIDDFKAIKSFMESYGLD